VPEYLYQIKGKEHPDVGLNWAWPPVFTGKVEAPDKKAAKALVDEEYGKTFPLRVLAKDLDSNEFLLSLKEIKENDHYTRRLFEVRTCKHCQRPYKIIEKYTFNSPGGGPDFCSRECSREHEAMFYVAPIGASPPVIYCITNKATGLCYIGKTRQVFTLRWYQHFFHPSDTKFHRAIRGTPVVDWCFEILEVVHVPAEVRELGMVEVDRLICGREMAWIKEKDAIRNGYNTQGLVDDGQQDLVPAGAVTHGP